MTSDEPAREARGRRAQRMAETRRRIVEAAVELHTTRGPARTTVSGVAERAGVQRHTLYAHFPEVNELFAACSGLWRERNPFPDVERWAAIADPHDRLAQALEEVYSFYDRSGRDLVAVFAGAEGEPAMAAYVKERDAQSAAMARLLARGRRCRGRRRQRLLAAIEHALHLDTWRSLIIRGGMQRAEAVTALLAMVDAAEAATPPPLRAVPRSDPSADGTGRAARVPTSSSARAAPSATARATPG